jgi:acyl carrier protein
LEGIAIIKQLEELFDGFLTAAKIDEITKNYEKYKGIPITQLGVDSLAVMGLALRVQSMFHKNIDFEKFDVRDMETLEKIEHFIESE